MIKYDERCFDVKNWKEPSKEKLLFEQKCFSTLKRQFHNVINVDHTKEDQKIAYNIFDHVLTKIIIIQSREEMTRQKNVFTSRSMWRKKLRENDVHKMRAFATCSWVENNLMSFPSLEHCPPSNFLTHSLFHIKLPVTNHNTNPDHPLSSS